MYESYNIEITINKNVFDRNSWMVLVRTKRGSLIIINFLSASTLNDKEKRYEEKCIYLH